jgi:hypothetical protein
MLRLDESVGGAFLESGSHAAMTGEQFTELNLGGIH